MVNCFWAHGYESTSVRDLEKACGLGTTSLYNAFGDKRAMFLAALDNYSERRTRALIHEVERLASPATRITAFVERVTEAAQQDPDRLGCFVINTAIEFGTHDREIAAVVAGHLGEVEDFFRRSLEAAIAAGEAPLDLAPADMARALCALMFGLRVLARSHPDRDFMEGATRPLLALLRAGSGVEASTPSKHKHTINRRNACPQNTT